MEKVKEDNTIHENDIELCLYEFCEKYNIDDMTKESQNRFNAFLMYTCKRLFKGTRILKDIHSRYNEYDYIKVMDILYIYIELCNLYSKEISINGFSKLTDIEYETILKWNDDSRTDAASAARLRIYKTLIAENERSNSDLLSSSPRTLGIMARLNHVHNWNMPGVREQKAGAALVARENMQLLPGENSVAIDPNLPTIPD